LERIVNSWHIRPWYLLYALLLFFQVVQARNVSDTSTNNLIDAASLPLEARQAIAAINEGPPYRYKKDGIVFGNYQGLLPKQRRGYYHEFTVKTPGRQDRGPQRLVVGGKYSKTNEIYYTADHYASFHRIKQ
jgi:ribonuclease T1